MPGFNRTGPRGLGPRTGGGRGLCNPRQTARGGYGTGRGLGRNRGSNRILQVRRRGSVPDTGMNVNEDIDFLKGQVQAMRDEAATIEKQIEELEKLEV